MELLYAHPWWTTLWIIIIAVAISNISGKDENASLHDDVWILNQHLMKEAAE